MVTKNQNGQKKKRKENTNEQLAAANGTIDNSVNDAARAWTSTIERENRTGQREGTTSQAEEESQESGREHKFVEGQQILISSDEDDNYENYLKTLKTKKKGAKRLSDDDDDFIVPDDQDISDGEFSSSPKLSLIERIQLKSGKKKTEKGKKTEANSEPESDDHLPTRKKVKEKLVSKEKVKSPVLKSSLPKLPETPDSSPTISKPKRNNTYRNVIRSDSSSSRNNSPVSLRSDSDSPVSSRGRTVSTRDSPLTNQKPTSTLKKVSKKTSKPKVTSTAKKTATNDVNKPINKIISELEGLEVTAAPKVTPKSKGSTAKKKDADSMKTPINKMISKIEDLEVTATPRTLTFLSSLTIDTPKYRCHPDAIQYTNNFKKKREELAKRLYALYNKEIFEYCLPRDMEISWNVRLTKTAGLCYSKRHKNKFGVETRTSRIELSSKVLDSGDRLRDTLIHEMCHAASWIISGYRDGHGPQWRVWAEKANTRFPELPLIDRCHTYQINTKFNYVCQGCGYTIGRHSKSLDTEKKVCGHCHGRFSLQVNAKTATNKENTDKKSESVPRTPSAFALFTKENYHVYRKAGTTHQEVMTILSQKFKQKNEQK